MSDFNYIEYLKNNPLLNKEENTLITEKKYKQGYDDREDESLGARRGAEKDKKQSFKDRRDDSYGKFGKRDAEAKGKAKGPGKNKVNKEGVEEAAPGYTHDCAAHVMHESYGYGLCLEGRHTLVETTEGHGEVTHYDVMFKSGEIVEKIPVNELKVLTSEMHHHGKSEEDDMDPKNEAMEPDEDERRDKKMKMSELKAQIREDILSILSEQEEDVDVDIEDEVEADVDVDVEDEVNVDAEGDDIEIEKKAVKAKVEVGLSPEEEIVQDSLKAAMDAASALGSEKLADQIGNTITFFTREFVVGDRSD